MYLRIYSIVLSFLVSLILDCCLLTTSSTQGITFVLDKKMIRNDEDRKALQEIINNTHLCEGYRTLAREVAGISPEDIYEAHLLPAGVGLESALQKLAATFANAFGNAGCGQVKTR